MNNTKKLNRKRIRFALILIGLFIMLVQIYMNTSAMSKKGGIIWQLGVVDSSFYEFGQNVFSKPDMQVNVFTIGKDTTFAKWSAVLPAVTDKKRDKEAAQEIKFSISELKQGFYELTLHCIFKTDRIPNLSIYVNSYPGYCVFTPKRLSSLKNFWSTIINKYSFDRVKISIPSAMLKQGINTIKFLPRMEPALPLDSLKWKSLKTSESFGAITWDAITFSEPAATGTVSNFPEVTVRPTVFYVQRSEKLFEWVNAIITINSPIVDGSIALSTGEVKLVQKINMQYDFGRILVPFLIPVKDDMPLPLKWELTSSGKKFTGEVVIEPAKKWKMYLTPRSHLDVGYTEEQAGSMEMHTLSIDKFFTLIDRYPQYRWNLEGTSIIEEYQKDHREDQYRKLIQYMKEGKLGVNSFTASLLTQFASLEELFRANYAAMALRKRYGIPIKVASITDVPSVTMALPDVLSHLNIPYLINASNHSRSHPIDLLVPWEKKSPFYWKGLGNGKVLFLNADHYAHAMYYFGYPADLDMALDQIPMLLQGYTFNEFQPDAIMLYGLIPDNRFIQDGDADFFTKWNEWFAYPKIIFSTDREYFDYIVSRFPSYPGTLKGDGGAYWEDGIASSIRETVMARKAKYRLTDAEKLYTLVSQFYKSVRYPAEKIQKVWNDVILYTEHTWGSYQSTREPRSLDAQAQWAVKQAFARNARLGANALLESGLKLLEGILDVSGKSAVVFNSCNWTRSDWVEVDIDKNFWPVDGATKIPVMGEIVSVGKRKYRIRFLAEEVPSLGVKVYKVKPRGDGVLKESRILTENTIETPYYRIAFDRNREFIKSIVDLETGKELINPNSDYRMNQYLYVMGGEKSRMIRTNLRLPRPELNIVGSHTIKPTVVEKIPTGWRIVFSRQAPYTPSIISEWHLYEKMKRIDIINRFSKNEIDELEAVYFAFPFSLVRPDVRYDIQTGWLDPRKDLREGACNEWFGLQYGVTLSKDSMEVLWASPDVPLVTFGDIVKGKWNRTFSMDNGTIFSYVMNNYWFTNYQKLQSGDYTLRYSFTSGKKVEPDLRLRQALEVAHPLIGSTKKLIQLSWDRHLPNGKSLTYSLMNISPKSVNLVSLKGAEDGRGVICRLLNLTEGEISVSISSDIFRITEAVECQGDEKDLKSLLINRGIINYKLGPHRLATLRLFLEII